jgi:hypothetical protein
MPTKPGRGVPGLISDSEIERLILALARSGKPFSEEDAQVVLQWACELRVGHAMLQLALDGKKALRVREDGEVEIGGNAHE